LIDGFLLLLMIAAASLLGAQELFDADVWWHVRSGQWILSERTIPSVDAFTFTSGGRSWIDLHWLFQVVLAAAFQAGGVRGIIGTTAAVCAGAIAVVLMLRDRRWPTWLVTLCWLPALCVMSARFVPRPEIFSVLWMALYLTILLRVDVKPALAWFLPFFQVLWVNTHGLFVFGPIILAAYLAERAMAAVREYGGAGSGPPSRGSRWWAHVGGATVLVGIACLVNPYGLRGALFPLGLFPKITAWGGLYKTYITEFGDLREFVRKQGPWATGSLYLRAECFLLWALPVSFVIPAVWRLSRSGARRTAIHVGALAAFVTLITLSVLAFPAPGTPDWMIGAGRLVPPATVVLGALHAAVLVPSSPRAASLAFIGGFASAAWMIWVRLNLFGPEPGPSVWLESINVREYALGWGTALVMLAAAWLVLRAGGRLFILIIAIMFGYLALQAIRNMNLFGLASGIVLTWNLGGWAHDVASSDENHSRRGPGPAFAHHAARVLVAALIGLMIFTIVTGRFFRATGEPRRFGLRESPAVFAHDAARFAGQAGLPDRVLAYDLVQAAVTIFHNGPARKVYMDGRLQVPDQDTFAKYVRVENMLNEGRSGWAEPLRRMGEPLVLLGHSKEFGAEATLLVDPGWRCIYFDATASIFLSNSRRDLKASFPGVDFAARYFHDEKWRTFRQEPEGIAEGKALLNLGWALKIREGLSGMLPTSIVLSAGHRFRQAIADDRGSAENWTLLGTCCWDMIADLKTPPPGPAEPWDIARGMFPAQASYCFRRALELDPASEAASSSFLRSLEARGMRDPDRALNEPGDFAGDCARAPARPGRARDDRQWLARRVDRLLEEGRFEAVFPSIAEAEGRGIVSDWATSDRVASTLLHLGRPVDAQRVWERAVAPPSRALRLSRIATAALASEDFAAARAGFESALKLDAGLGEAWFGLALLHAQLGEAEEGARACEAGLRPTLTEAQAGWLRVFQELFQSRRTGASEIQETE
jgi:hypothetical protein